MSEVVQGEKSLRVIFWNPREVIAEAATTIVDMEGDAEGKSRSIGEFLHSLPEEKRVAVRKIHGFMLTGNHTRLSYVLIHWEMQEMADAMGLPVEVYVCERGQHTAPEFQLRAEPRSK